MNTHTNKPHFSIDELLKLGFTHQPFLNSYYKDGIQLYWNNQLGWCLRQSIIDKPVPINTRSELDMVWELFFRKPFPYPLSEMILHPDVAIVPESLFINCYHCLSDISLRSSILNYSNEVETRNISVEISHEWTAHVECPICKTPLSFTHYVYEFPKNMRSHSHTETFNCKLKNEW